MRKILWIVPLLFAVISAPIARADTVNFTITDLSGGPESGNLTLTYDPSNNNLISLVTGQFGGYSVFNSPIDPNAYNPVTQTPGFYGNDNLLVLSPQGALLPDGGGFAFQTEDAQGNLVDQYNLFDGTTGIDLPNSPDGGDVFVVTDLTQYNNLSNGDYTPADDYDVVTVSTTPEPSSVALMLLGIGCLVVMRKRVAPGLQQVV